ncbi:hypothetical protein L227DRAFT_568832 [Lentinus tigrinus ALCF2SS1-6]|uniref:Uncharacterized protein n=1 Tax=Lentinus tigrinus ALCF2SS1-6 TaxID=1328759 RepID=A0A5C2RKL2_9APHY|nr:hypothetical protein L227DRAFT_568832 [Lentinus tigrinus ALCF2SS1-6]
MLARATITSNFVLVCLRTLRQIYHKPMSTPIIPQRRCAPTIPRHGTSWCFPRVLTLNLWQAYQAEIIVDALQHRLLDAEAEVRRAIQVIQAVTVGLLLKEGSSPSLQRVLLRQCAHLGEAASLACKRTAVSAQFVTHAVCEGVLADSILDCYELRVFCVVIVFKTQDIYLVHKVGLATKTRLLREGYHTRGSHLNLLHNRARGPRSWSAQRTTASRQLIQSSQRGLASYQDAVVAQHARIDIGGLQPN